MSMKYTLPAHSLLEIEELPEGILITETRPPGDSSHSVFICEDRLEEVIEIFRIAQATYNNLNNC
jgi:hypothetical protein